MTTDAEPVAPARPGAAAGPGAPAGPVAPAGPEAPATLEVAAVGPVLEPGAVRRTRPLALVLLADHDYRSYWLGSTSFALGIWGWITAMSYTAERLSGSPLQVSLVNVAYFLPMFLLALPAGVLADALDRRLVVMASRAVSAVLALGLTGLALADRLGYAALLVGSALIGTTVVSELAARQAYVAQLVPPERVAGATALGSVQGGLARVLGPLLCGWLLVLGGAPAGFLFFAVANLLNVFFFWRIRVPGTAPGLVGRPLEDLLDGLRYLRRHRDALAVVGVGILTGIVGWLHLAMLPILSVDRLDGDARTLGLLSAALGLGALPPSLLLALRSGGPRREGRLFVLASVAWGGGVVVLGLADTLAVALAGLVLAGAGQGTQLILVRTLLLRVTETAFHGRVLGTLTLTWGANVVGTLAGGGLAERYGVGTVVSGSGLLIALATLAVLAAHPRLWRL